jgi:hypothetical protein
MPLSFPGSPSVNDTYTVGQRTWTWDGNIWSLSADTIGSASVTSSEIASSAVTTAKIADANVTAAKIASDAVTTAKILDANVTTAKVAANAITQAKLASNLSAVTVTTTANRDTDIASPFTGQLAILTDTKKIQLYDGTSWVNVSLAPPETPTSLSATALSTTSVSIAFTAGGANGSPITNYKYALSTDSGSTYGSFTALSPEDILTPITISGLTVGTAYYIKLKAVNDMGDSVASAAVSISTLATPDAPTSLSAGSITVSSADISFTAGSDNGYAISNYQYALSTDSGSTYGSFTALSPADFTTPITITGLTQGTAYYIKIKGVNSGGAGAESSAVSFTTLQSVTVDYLVVAGGGGGGNHGGGGGGGGGAGGLRSTVTATGGGGTLETALTVVVATNYTATVGNGGSGGNGVSGSNGGNSVFSTITSLGGGGGAYSGIGTSGGSGGGNGHYEASASGGAGTANQGFAGGRANTDAASYGIGGGGGGAGSAGVGGAGGVAGAGGAGVSVSMVTSTPVTYANGGGAGSDYRSPAGAYAGGGGAGVVGTVNRGMGGGGGSYTSPSAGAAGGSGVVILRYPDTRTITIGAGLTGSTATDGSYKVTTLTAGSGNVSWA